MHWHWRSSGGGFMEAWGWECGGGGFREVWRWRCGDGGLGMEVLWWWLGEGGVGAVALGWRIWCSVAELGGIHYICLMKMTKISLGFAVW